MPSKEYLELIGRPMPQRVLEQISRMDPERISAKGQMGSARMGSLQISYFLTEGLFGYQSVKICQHLSNSINSAYLFPQTVKKHYFCSDPICVDPICPQPRINFDLVAAVVKHIHEKADSIPKIRRQRVFQAFSVP